MPASRASGDYLTFRDAADLFASKSELATVAEIKTAAHDTINARMDTLAMRIDAIVPRSEHELHWKLDADKFQEFNKKLDDLHDELMEMREHMASKIGVQELKEDVESIKAARFPGWFGIAIFGVVGSVFSSSIAIVVSHFIH